VHTRVNNTYTTYIYAPRARVCVWAHAVGRERQPSTFLTREGTRWIDWQGGGCGEKEKNCFEKVKTLTDPLQTLRTRQSAQRLQLRSTFRRPLCRLPANVLNPLIIIFVRVAYTFNVVPATRHYIYIYIYIYNNARMI